MFFPTLFLFFSFLLGTFVTFRHFFFFFFFSPFGFGLRALSPPQPPFAQVYYVFFPFYTSTPGAYQPLHWTFFHPRARWDRLLNRFSLNFLGGYPTRCLFFLPPSLGRTFFLGSFESQWTMPRTVRHFAGYTFPNHLGSFDLYLPSFFLPWLSRSFFAILKNF